MQQHDTLQHNPHLYLALADGIAARGNYTDMDIINFLTNVECLEGMFDTYGAFGFGFVGMMQSQELVVCCDL